MKNLFRFTLCVALFVLLVVPASAQMIGQGTDLWRTAGDGSTFASFALDPIPAGFFCAGSAPFTGKIAFQGVPVATEPSGVLNLTDTVIERLDDAAFNENGVATTRIQMAAMQFEGVEPFRSECGTFQVGVELDGEQPITEMKIIRERAFGGRFLADIHVNVKITFTPVDHGGDALEVSRELRFGPAANATWARRPDPGFTEFEGVVKVDFVGGEEVTPGRKAGLALKRGVFDMLYGPPAYYLGQVPEAYALTISSMIRRTAAGLPTGSRPWRRTASRTSASMISTAAGMSVLPLAQHRMISVTPEDYARTR